MRVYWLGIVVIFQEREKNSPCLFTLEYTSMSIHICTKFTMFSNFSLKGHKTQL